MTKVVLLTYSDTVTSVHCGGRTNIVTFHFLPVFSARHGRSDVNVCEGLLRTERRRAYRGSRCRGSCKCLFL